MIGVVLVVAGIVMLILPGPGLLVILIGLALLATEFLWARRALDPLRAAGRRGTGMIQRIAKRVDTTNPDQEAGSR